MCPGEISLKEYYPLNNFPCVDTFPNQKNIPTGHLPLVKFAQLVISL